MRQAREGVVVLLLLSVAALGAVPAAFRHAPAAGPRTRAAPSAGADGTVRQAASRGVIHVPILLGGVCAGVSAGVLTWLGGRRQQVPATCGVLAATFAAAMWPLAVESAAHPTRAALACTACAIGLSRAAARTRMGTVAAVGWVGLCGAMDWSAVVVACGFTRSGLLSLGSAGLGALAAAGLGSMPVTTLRLHETAFPLHRDLWLLMPVLLVAWYGWSAASGRTVARAATGGLLGVLLVAFGLPLQPRLCLLGLAGLAAAGTGRLAKAVRQSGSFARMAPVALAISVAILSLMSLRRWLDGLLLLVFLGQ